VMCQLLGVTRQGYYSYQRRQNNKPKDPMHSEQTRIEEKDRSHTILYIQSYI